jgi:hypothetical protein
MKATGNQVLIHIFLQQNLLTGPASVANRSKWVDLSTITDLTAHYRKGPFFFLAKKMWTSN